MAQQPKVNYLTNKDILKEIHKSKISFCSLTDEKYGQYDLILCSALDEFIEADQDLINAILTDPSTLRLAKENQASRIQSEGYTKAMLLFKSDKTSFPSKPKQKDFLVDIDTIADDDVVIRVMTYSHVPDAPGRKKTPKTLAETKERVNFPAFKQFCVINGEAVEVCRSHWQGSISNGHFDVNCGRITNKLGTMFLKLVERYSYKGNWRGYTYIDEMRGQALVNLSQVGLQFNEAKSQNPFAYYTAATNNSFTKVLNLEKKNQELRDDILVQNGFMPSYTRQLAHEDQIRNMRETAAEESSSANNSGSFSDF